MNSFNYLELIAFKTGVDLREVTDRFVERFETDEGVESFIDEINDGTSRDYFSAVLDSFPQVLRDRFDDIAQKRISNALNNLNEAMSSPLAKEVA